MRASLQKLIILFGAVALFAGANLPLRAQEPSAAGLWEQVDEKARRAWFKIAERNGVYEETIVKIFPEPGDDETWVCDKCEGAEKGAPVLGLKLIKGMRRNEMGTRTEPSSIRLTRNSASGIDEYDNRPERGAAPVARRGPHTCGQPGAHLPIYGVVDPVLGGW